MNSPIPVIPLLLLLGACADSSQPHDSTTPEQRAQPIVAAVSYPLAFFAEAIGGSLVDVSFPAPPDVDPAFWKPSPEDLAVYQGADVILANGAGYAAWLGTASLPASRIVDTARAFTDRLIEVEDAVVHTHGPEGDHSHGETAFTTWLDPTLAIEHARAVCAALEERLPDARDELRLRLAELEARLADLDERQAAAADSAVPLLGSHPVYQYLARRYALDLVSVHWEPDAEPDEAAWRELDALLAEHPARAMLWEAEPLATTRAKLAERGIASLVYAPMGNQPEEGDIMSGGERNVRSLAAACSRDE